MKISICVPGFLMAIRSLTYLDIPASKRQETASKAVARLRDRVNDPTTSPDQRALLMSQLAKMEQWVSGTIPGTTPPTEGP